MSPRTRTLVAVSTGAGITLALTCLALVFLDPLVEYLGCLRSPPEMREMGNYCGHGQGVGFFMLLAILTVGSGFALFVYLRIPPTDLGNQL